MAPAIARWRPGDDPGAVAAALERGAIVAIPTESSYGLAVDPADPAGVAAIFRAKGREGAKPLPVVGASPAAFLRLGVDPDDPALAWGTARWPAALSVLVALAHPIPASAGERTLAVRMPGHAPLLELLRRLDRPLTATSANPSGEAPLLTSDAVAEWLAAAAVDALVVDGGRLPGGPPSTLVALENGRPVVIRPGRVEVA